MSANAWVANRKPVILVLWTSMTTSCNMEREYWRELKRCGFDSTIAMACSNESWVVAKERLSDNTLEISNTVYKEVEFN